MRTRRQQSANHRESRPVWGAEGGALRDSDALVPLVTVHQLTQWGSALVMHRDALSPFSCSLSVEGSRTGLPCSFSLFLAHMSFPLPAPSLRKGP